MNVQNFLKEHNIEFTLHEHPAVYTCEEAEKHCGNIPGIACKNLVLQDKKGLRYFLLVLPAKKQTDLKKFAGFVNVSKVTFASGEMLKEKLGLDPGSVSPFGLLNDEKKEVELYLNQEVANADIVSFHPNVNTATLALSQAMFRKFLQAIGCVPHVVEL